MVAGRALRAAATLLVSSFLISAALYISPGSPLGFLTGGRTLPPAQLDQLKQQYHLSDPFFVRYWDWLKGAVHGDFGQSIMFHQDVGSLISARAGSTIFLVVYASLLILVLGVGLGIVAAMRGGKVDGAITVGTTIGLGTPSFVTAVLLVTVFAVGLGWFPAFGSGTGFLDRTWHMTLPAFALAIAGLAFVSQTTRAAMGEEVGREHVQTARSRGVPNRLIIRRHVLRNAAIPITTAAGLTVAYLVAGVAVIEKAFNLQGIGSYLIEAVSQKDFAVVQAISLILVTIFIVTNTVVDILYRLLDPRLRTPERR
jgi:peptide/nickel transport system permease protein